MPSDHLTTLVFERMCTTDPRIRGRLRPCHRRLVVSVADSSPLMVCGELCMTIVFPGLQCDMMLIIASTGSEGLLGTDALQSCLPHQLDLAQIALLWWANGGPTVRVLMGQWWQPPVAHCGRVHHASVGPPVASHRWASVGPPLGQRWLATGGPTEANGTPTISALLAHRWRVR